MRAEPGQIESLQELDMYVEICGEGSPLVLLHGFSGAGCNWELIFPEAPTGFQLIVPDLRGHGRSTNPSGKFTHRQSALDVFALLDQLGIRTFQAIGMSCGAKTLLHMATQQPDRVEAMVLVSATPYFPKEARIAMSQLSPDNRSETEWEQMRQWHKHEDDQIRLLWTLANQMKDSYEDMNFTPPLLSTIKAQTLIVHGDRDPLYPVSLALEMYQAIPKAALWVVPNGGHGPIFGDQTPHFVVTALNFLTLQ
ncbi:MAG: alpha/beta hydrolase [Acidobacteria bacterium]|nr:alpha/beta hydrolase [Acidobacteriota bacterium]